MSMSLNSTSPDWPPLPFAEWENTRDTVHMWTQIVGKTRMAREPRVNHWWNVTLYPFAQVQQFNPYWIQAWQWSTHRAQPPSFFGFNPDTPDESFLRWIFWDNLGGLFFLGISMLTMSVVCGGIGSTLGLITTRWRPAAIHKRSEGSE